MKRDPTHICLHSAARDHFIRASGSDWSLPYQRIEPAQARGGPTGPPDLFSDGYDAEGGALQRPPIWPNLGLGRLFDHLVRTVDFVILATVLPAQYPIVAPIAAPATAPTGPAIDPATAPPKPPITAQ